MGLTYDMPSASHIQCQNRITKDVPNTVLKNSDFIEKFRRNALGPVLKTGGLKKKKNWEYKI